LPQDPVNCTKLLKEYGLKVSYMLVTNWLDPQYKHGAFSNTNSATLKNSIKLCKEGIDFAKTVNADSVLLWPAHDGFDYPFQVNYYDAWKRLIDSITELAEYAGDFKLAIEPKPKDPRQKMFINGTGTLLHVINKIGRKNVGGALDIGHSIAAQENMAYALALLDNGEKLFQIHLNDNYKDADPDMVMGTINFFETLEFFYYLLKTKYSGWCSIDIITPRDDRAKTLFLASKMIIRYQKMAEKLIDCDSQFIDNMNGYKFSDNMDLIFNILF
jgi:xylose isomerase